MEREGIVANTSLNETVKLSERAALIALFILLWLVTVSKLIVLFEINTLSESVMEITVLFSSANPLTSNSLLTILALGALSIRITLFNFSAMNLNPSTVTFSEIISIPKSYKVALSLNKLTGLSIMILSIKLENSPMNVKSPVILSLNTPYSLKNKKKVSLVKLYSFSLLGMLFSTIDSSKVSSTLSSPSNSLETR